MARSFGLVDEKIAEADFFLEKLSEARWDLFAVRCYFNAFVAAARSITFVLQAVMTDEPGFSAWYHEKQKGLRSNNLARFFLEARNVTQKRGEHPVTGGLLSRTPDGQVESAFIFSASERFPPVPALDVVTACENYAALLLNLILDCYQDFGQVIDPDQYYTAEAFSQHGLTVDDADEKLFGIRGWTNAPEIPMAARWQLLRDSIPECAIDDLFKKYTGRSRPQAQSVPPMPSSNSGWPLPQELRTLGDDNADVERFIESLKERDDT